MSSEDDVVEYFRLAALEMKQDVATRIVGHVSYRGVEEEVVRWEALHHGVNVGLRTVLKGEPVGASGNGRQKVMVPSAS